MLYMIQFMKCVKMKLDTFKELGLDAIHDTVHEMCKDEARHI